MSDFLLNKSSFKLIIDSDQYVTVKASTFLGKKYACDKMVKLNVEMNKICTFIYMLSYTIFWHAHLIY